MKLTSSVQGDDYEYHIEPLGRSPALWNLYTQLTFCYPMNDATKQQKIIDVLMRGLERLAASFPWTAGQVVKEKLQTDGSDYYLIKPLEPTPRFVVKDLSNELPSFREFEQSAFPIRLLNENMVAPRNTKSVSHDADPKPVFMLQATFIMEGLLLTFAGQHGTLDIVGESQVIRLLSKACHDFPFTSEEVSLGNCDRREVIPLLDTSEMESMDDKDPIEKNQPHVNTAVNDSGKSSNSASQQCDSKNVWMNFLFSADSLKTLKAFAMDSITLTSEFVSTDDSLSAFIWRCVSRARQPRLKATDSSTFARTVDLRRYLDVSSIYPGNLAAKTFTTYTFQQILDKPLGEIALQLRRSIDPKITNIGYQARATATKMVHPSKKNPPPKPSRDLSKDIAFSSWAKTDFCYDVDFNLGLGKPEAVRRPAFAPPGEQPMEGVVYLLPKRQDGEIAVTVCIRKEDMNMLCTDDEWTKYAKLAD